MADDDGPLPHQEFSQLLQRASQGDPAAADELMRAMEKDLRKIASVHLRRERANHTLQTTALINEALIKLIGPGRRQWSSSRHFLAVASRIMRRLLVDYARRPNAPKIPLDLAHAFGAFRK